MKRIQIFFLVIILSIIYLSINVNSAFVIKDSAELINAYKNHNLVRLHVIANSNSPRDQYLKRKVRNKIIKSFAADLKNEDYQAGLTQNNTEKIRAVIENELTEKGVKYSTRISFGNYFFPRRTYGNYTLPSGKYKALKITLGKGQGSNWWCVLLPPLCIEYNMSKIDNSNFKGDLTTNTDVKFQFKMAEVLDEIDHSNTILSKFHHKYSILKQNIQELFKHKGFSVPILRENTALSLKTKSDFNMTTILDRR